jgi:hypothetical protein
MPDAVWRNLDVGEFGMPIGRSLGNQLQPLTDCGSVHCRALTCGQQGGIARSVAGYGQASRQPKQICQRMRLMQKIDLNRREFGRCHFCFASLALAGEAACMLTFLCT